MSERGRKIQDHLDELFCELYPNSTKTNLIFKGKQ